MRAILSDALRAHDMLPGLGELDSIDLGGYLRDALLLGRLTARALDDGRLQPEELLHLGAALLGAVERHKRVNHPAHPAPRPALTASPEPRPEPPAEPGPLHSDPRPLVWSVANPVDHPATDAELALLDPPAPHALDPDAPELPQHWNGSSWVGGHGAVAGPTLEPVPMLDLVSDPETPTAA